MKRTLILTVLALFIIGVLSGCTGNAAPADTNPSETEPTAAPSPTQNNNTGAGDNQGITVNKINFETLQYDQLPADKQKIIDVYKLARCYTYWQDGDSYVIGIFAGEKPTAGYTISVKSVEDNEGKTIIVVEETSPKDAAAEVLTYPYTIIKASQITDNFVVVNTDNESFTQVINKENISTNENAIQATGTYNGAIDPTSVEITMEDGSIKAFMITDIADVFKNIKENAKLSFVYYVNEYGQNVITDVDVVE